MGLEHSLRLPCGAVLKNRLAKSAMSDSLGDGKGNPTQAQIRLYEKWAKGGIGLSIIGEVQIDSLCPEKPGNLVLGKGSNIDALQELARLASLEEAHIWPQLGHAGALSHRPISEPMGPSALNIDDFQCAGMSIKEVEALPSSYAKAALLAKKVGFTGIQIHAGHGFLLSQFLSPLFNRRNDHFGGSIKKRCRIIIDIIDRIRQTVGPNFPIGIKLNASDLIEGGLTNEDALENIRLLNQTSLDLIEVSGGTYFPGAESSSDRVTQDVYYADFCLMAKQITNIPIMVTGGIKTCADALYLIKNESADIVGIARALVLNPNLTNDWLNGEPNPVFPRFESPPPEGITAWYTMRINAISLDKETNFTLDLTTAIKQYLERDALRSATWQKKFGTLAKRV